MSVYTSKKQHGKILVFSILICLAWSWFAGKDLNWDQINYHVYTPHSFWNNRIGQDFFPASIQSYLNPLSYIPFYLMVVNQWPDLLIGSTLATLHAFNLYFLCLICKTIWPNDKHGISGAALFALIIGLLSPIFWQEVGSSFNDITACAFVLAAVYLAISGATYLKVFLVGVLLGTATGLKLPFGVFGLGAIVLLISSDFRFTIRRVFVYGVGGLAAVALCHGWWSWTLWREFGNPVFPFFNGVFKSPLYLAENINLVRFTPGKFSEWLALPFEIAEPVSWVYTETLAPDLRLLLFTIGLLVCAVVTISGRKKVIRGQLGDSQLKQLQILCFAIICGCLWVVTSANGRYGMPLSLLTGILIVSIFRYIISSDRYFALVLISITSAQLIHVVANSSARWSQYAWGGGWFELQVPKELKETSALFLSFGSQPNAFLSVWLHPHSSVINLVGQHVLPRSGAQYEKLKRLADSQSQNVYLLVEWSNPVPFKRSKYFRVVQKNLNSYGYSFASDECSAIKFLNTMEKASASTIGNSKYILACRLMVKTAVEPDDFYITGKKILGEIEKKCPDSFKPHGVEPSFTRSGVNAFYVGTEFFVHITTDGEVYGTQVRSATDFSLGRTSDWLKSTDNFVTCPKRRRASPWFLASGQFQ